LILRKRNWIYPITPRNLSNSEAGDFARWTAYRVRASRVGGVQNFP
jgi:hypothetical protein